ncbi:MAG: methyl viologen-reducing hydrogenase [Pseudomonadota bacterium]
MAIRIAEEWLNICGGCEMTMLDIGEPLLDLLEKIEIVHMPFLMDSKYLDPSGDPDKIEIPEADIGLISGGVRNEKEKHVAEEMRKKCKKLVALGTCACYGGIPAMANMWPKAGLMEKVFRGCKTTEAAADPAEKNLPPLTDRVMAVDEVVKVDAMIPGCPTSPDWIVEALLALIDGKPWSLPDRSVCDVCPSKREKKAGGTLKRTLEPVACEIPGKLDTMLCLMEQGFLCLGPVTKAGCGGNEKTPRCIKGLMPCRGCMGPVRKGANPMVDMMGALSSIGLDAKTLLDRRAIFNRYVGGHNLLRPLPQPPVRR